MKIIVISFKRSQAHTAALSASYPEAGHHWPMPPPETPGYSQASLGLSLVGSLLLSPGSWCIQDFVCALQESVSPVLCKFCNHIPLASKVKFSGGSQSLWQIPRLGIWGSQVVLVVKKKKKKSACQHRRHWTCWFDPLVRKIPWSRIWHPTLVLLPRKSHGQRSLVVYSPWSHKELDTTEHKI